MYVHLSMFKTFKVIAAIKQNESKNKMSKTLQGQFKKNQKKPFLTKVEYRLRTQF